MEPARKKHNSTAKFVKRVSMRIEFNPAAIQSVDRVVFHRDTCLPEESAIDNAPPNASLGSMTTQPSIGDN